MRNIFIGFIFVFVNLNLTLNEHVLGLLPCFVGYFFINKGLHEFSETVSHFDKLHSIVSVMFVYTIITYVMDLFGFGAANDSFIRLFSQIMGLGAVIGSLYVSYHVSLGVKELETLYGCGINISQLFTRWKIMAVANIASMLFVIVPIVNLICIIVTIVAGIMYLVAFNDAKNRYYAKQLT